MNKSVLKVRFLVLSKFVGQKKLILCGMKFLHPCICNGCRMHPLFCLAKSFSIFDFEMNPRQESNN